MKWEQSPSWATHKLTLEGGTTLWSMEAPKEIIIGVGENTQKIGVVSVEQHPGHKTYYGAFEGWWA